MRQLTAIVFTDMVGFTALMQEDEQRARRQRDRQRKVLDASIEAHGGRILEVHGDGTLSVFPSAVAAVESAIEIQRRLMGGSPVPLRIGIHTGDVVHDENGVFGDGVNVAARVQSLAPPGGILISAKVHDEVKNQPQIRTWNLGPVMLKNVQRPIEIHAVEGEHLVRPDPRALLALRPDRRRSVAVLPFVNMSSDPENEYFSDGITEEIINALTRIEGLRVTARTSSFAYKNRQEDVRSIAAALDVSTILEGSVRRHGGRVRITVQLIDAAEGYHVFSEVYDRSLDDIFATQDEIASAVSQLLRGALEDAPPDATEPPAPASPSPAAYTEYLKGLSSWNEWTPGGARRAIKHFERSIELDPTSSLPYATMTTAYIFLGATGHVTPSESYPRAESTAQRALELSDSGEAHLATALVRLFYRWDFAGAYRSFQNALERIPGSVEVHQMYALYLQAVGDLEGALREARTAAELDPLNSGANHTLGEAYYCLGRYDEALEHLRRTLELDPDFRAATETMGHVYLTRGEPERALDAWQGVVDRLDDPMKFIPHRALAYAALGRSEDVSAMEALLARREAEQPDVELCVDWALLAMAKGDLDEAFRRLEEAVELRLGALIVMAHHPFWERLRSDLRFDQLMDQMGMPRPVAA